MDDYSMQRYWDARQLLLPGIRQVIDSAVAYGRTLGHEDADRARPGEVVRARLELLDQLERAIAALPALKDAADGR